MNALSPSDFCGSNPHTLPQGTLVDYVIPHAQKLELTGRQKGVVLSLSDYNASNRRPVVCPIVYGESSINEAWGIEIPVKNGQPCFLRPDLSEILSIPYAQITPVKRADSGEPCLFPAEIVRSAQSKLLEIISPTDEKLAERGKGFLAYGQIGWAHAVPRATEAVTDRAPILNLTPPEVYSQTGMALISRAYSHLEKYDPRHCVAVGSSKWFSTGFFPVSDLHSVPVKYFLAGRSGFSPISAGGRALKGYSKKMAGLFTSEAYREIVRRYSGPHGQLPGFIIAARNNISHECSRR